LLFPGRAAERRMAMLRTGLAGIEDELLGAVTVRVHVDEHQQAGLAQLAQAEVGDLDVTALLRGQLDSRRGQLLRCVRLRLSLFLERDHPPGDHASACTESQSPIPSIRHPEYTRARLAQTSERLRERVYPDTREPDELLVAGPVDRISFEDAAALEYRSAELGVRLGPLWSTYWFRLRATVPGAWRGR